MGKYAERGVKGITDTGKYEELCQLWSEDIEDAQDLWERLNKKRAKVELMRLQLHEQESELQKLEDEFKVICENEKVFMKQAGVKWYSNFEDTLTDEQIKSLLPVVNKWVFEDVHTVESMREWLECRNVEPVKVKDVGELCYFLNELRDNGYICGNCQTVAEENRTFAGGRGAVVTQKSLTVSLYKKRPKDEYGRYDGILNHEIHEAVEALKGMKV